MTRQLLVKTNSHPYHITARCLNKEFFPLPLPQMWFIMMRQLKRCHLENGLGIHAFVLMGNHFHLLCHTPFENIDQCMHQFMRGTSVDVNQRLKSKNSLWDGHYRWSVIRSQTHYFQVYRYIYQNPVRAELVERVEEYQFSSLKRDLPFPLHTNVPISFCGEEGELLWLNEKYQEEDLSLIKLGLRKSQFDLEKRKLKAFNKLSVPKINN